MSSPYFVNGFVHEIDVPTSGGYSVIVKSGKYVQGSYFIHLTYLGLLTQVFITPDPKDVVYVYPESTGGGTSTITEIDAGEGLIGGGNTGAVPLAVGDLGITTGLIANAAVTAAKIASGEVVKSFNTLKDAVVLAAGTNVTLTPAGNTITVAASGLASVSPTAPLNLSLSGGGSILSGSIAVTPANPGGAVALQTGSTTTQTGSIDISGTIKVGVLSSENFALSGAILTAGAYNFSGLTDSSFACDCTSGTISFNLPTLDSSFPSGTLYFFIKTDSSLINNVLLSPASGQTINGQSSKVITVQYSVVRLQAFTSASNNFWVII